MSGRIAAILVLVLAGCFGDPGSISGTGEASLFAGQTILYRPAPGQGAAVLDDPTAATGAPDGRTVTLGGFGGSITLRMNTPIIDRPGEPDFVIWGNAFYIGGDPRIRWAEPGLVEVSTDAVTWHLIGGSVFNISNPPTSNALTVTWTNNSGTNWPAWAEGMGTLTLSNTTLGPVFLDRLRASDSAHTNSPAEAGETLYGFADVTPKGNAPTGAWLPDNPFVFGVQGSGGDAVSLEWAVDRDGNPLYEAIRHLEFRYVRITTAVHVDLGVLGECSTEIDAVGVCP